MVKIAVQAHYQIGVCAVDMRHADRRSVYAITHNDISATDWDAA